MFPVSIIALDKIIFEGEVQFVTAPATLGEITVLKNHIPLVATLQKGKVKVKIKDDLLEFGINGGIIEVKPNKVVVLTKT